MIVIIEGPDGAGKTHLAQALANQHGLTYHHEGPPPAGVDPLYHYGSLLEEARATRAGVVFDRFALGERVYGPILRGKDGFGDDGWRVFTRLLRAAGAHHILCLPDYTTCYDSWASGRAELFHNRTLFGQTYSGWTHWSHRQLDAQITLVYDYKRDPRTPWLSGRMMWRSPVIGDPLARYLLVGDRGSDPMCATDLAFFGRTDSAAYLTRALDVAGFHEHELAWLNAFKVDGSPNEIQGHESFTRVIALGNLAAGECRRQGVEYLPVPHPQYWRRFRHHDMEEYAGMLREARKQ